MFSIWAYLPDGQEPTVFYPICDFPDLESVKAYEDAYVDLIHSRADIENVYPDPMWDIAIILKDQPYYVYNFFNPENLTWSFDNIMDSIHYSLKPGEHVGINTRGTSGEQYKIIQRAPISSIMPKKTEDDLFEEFINESNSHILDRMKAIRTEYEHVENSMEE